MPQHADAFAWVAELLTCVSMKDFLRNAEHLVRVVLLLAIGTITFLLVRHVVIPRDFGKYGHFRPASMDDVRARPIKFAGHEACEACHADQVETKNKGKHANVGCEACHGPLARHVEDPVTVAAKPPVTAVSRDGCHEA